MNIMTMLCLKNGIHSKGPPSQAAFLLRLLSGALWQAALPLHERDLRAKAEAFAAAIGDCLGKVNISDRRRRNHALSK